MTRLDARSWLALCAVYIVWGSTFLGIAIVSHAVPPLLGAGTRFIVAGAILTLALVATKGPRAFHLPLRQLAGAAGTGVLLLTIGIGVLSLAVQFIPSGASALIVATEPLWIVLFRWRTGQTPSRATLLGVVAGLLGIGVLVAFFTASNPSPGEGYEHANNAAIAGWMLMLLLATVAWSWGSFDSPRLVSRGRAPRDPFVSTAYQFLFGGVALVVIGVLFGEDVTKLATNDVTVLGAWLYIVVGALVAFTCYVWLLHNVPVSIVSTYAYVNPLVAVLLGYLILSEPMSGAVIAAMALILIGVGLVVRGERGPEDRTSTPADR